MNNLKIKEFEAIVTARAILDELLKNHDGTYQVDFSYKAAVIACQTTLCKFLIEKNLNKVFWPYIRRNRIFLFYLPKRKVAAEVGIITDESENNLRHRLRIELMGYKGMALPETFADIIESIDRPKHFINKRRKYGVSKHFRTQKTRE